MSRPDVACDNVRKLTRCVLDVIVLCQYDDSELHQTQKTPCEGRQGTGRMRASFNSQVVSPAPVAEQNILLWPQHSLVAPTPPGSIRRHESRFCCAYPTIWQLLVIINDIVNKLHKQRTREVGRKWESPPKRLACSSAIRSFACLGQVVVSVNLQRTIRRPTA